HGLIFDHTKSLGGSKTFSLPYCYRSQTDVYLLFVFFRVALINPLQKDKLTFIKFPAQLLFRTFSYLQKAFHNTECPLNKLRCCHDYCTANLPWNQYLKCKCTIYTDNRQTSTYFLLFLLFLLSQLTFQIGNPGTQFIYIFSGCNAEIFGHFLCLFILFGVPLICFHFAFIHQIAHDRSRLFLCAFILFYHFIQSFIQFFLTGNGCTKPQKKSFFKKVAHDQHSFTFYLIT